MSQHEQHDMQYFVVINHENQHSIWPAHKSLPLGWRAEGAAKPKEACLDYIAQHWTDITPLSARGVAVNQN